MAFTIKDRITKRPRITYGILGAIILVIVLVVVFARDSSEDGVTAEQQTPTVEVASIAALSRDTEALTLLGEVRSVSQAELRAEKPGQVTRVNVRAGQVVRAGTILAEIDNASERAAVLSAQGTVAAAEASLAKVNAGARSEDRVSAAVQTESAAVSLQSAREAARNSMSQAYSLIEDAVFAKTDDFFTNPYTVDPSFRVRSASYDERQAIEATRVSLGETLQNWKSRATSGTVPVDQLDAALRQSIDEAQRVKTFLNQISGFVAEQEISDVVTAADKSAQEAQILAARSNVDSALAALTGARQSLTSARSGAAVTSLSESKLTQGERPEDIAAAEAQVTQARGTLASALAQLEKSLIRTPIAGTVETFDISTGDFVSAQQVVAVVANPGALEIEAFVSQSGRERLAVGDTVLVGGSFEGTITTLAPGLDPTTKKARLTVGLPDEASLVNGQFVEIASIHSEEDAEVAQSTQDGYLVPITAIKVLPQSLVVLTVRDDNVIESLPIAEGPIVGASMLVRDIDPATRIVRDARGISEGDHVEIATE